MKKIVIFGYILLGLFVASFISAFAYVWYIAPPKLNSFFIMMILIAGAYLLFAILDVRKAKKEILNMFNPRKSDDEELEELRFSQEDEYAKLLESRSFRTYSSGWRCMRI